MRGLEWKSWLFLDLAIFLQELSKSYIINQAPSPPPGGVTFTRRLLTESRCRRALHPHGRTGQERFHLPCGREPLAKALTLSRSSNSRLWGISRRKCRLLTLKKKNHGASQAIQWLSFRFSMQGGAASVLAMGGTKVPFAAKKNLKMKITWSLPWASLVLIIRSVLLMVFQQEISL